MGIFEECDKDGSGSLSLNEFSKLAENSDNQEVKDRMKRIFEMADQAGWITPKDQKLTLEEFTMFNQKAIGKEDPPPDASTLRNRCIQQYYMAKKSSARRQSVVDLVCNFC